MEKITVKQKRVSLLLKCIVFLSAFIGTFLSAYAGRNSFMGGNRVFMYFTIQSNIAIAIICLIGAVFISKKGHNQESIQVPVFYLSYVDKNLNKSL